MGPNIKNEEVEALVELGTVLSSGSSLPAYRITKFLYELEITAVPFGSARWRRSLAVEVPLFSYEFCVKVKSLSDFRP